MPSRPAWRSPRDPGAGHQHRPRGARRGRGQCPHQQPAARSRRAGGAEALPRAAALGLRHLFADADYADPKLRRASTRSATGPSRSSSATTRRRVSRSSPAAGTLSGRSPGSDDAIGSQRTGRRRSHPPRSGSSSPTSDCSRGASQGTAPPEKAPGQALRGHRDRAELK
jgi:hypothetical protein